MGGARLVYSGLALSPLAYWLGTGSSIELRADFANGLAYAGTNLLPAGPPVRLPA